MIPAILEAYRAGLLDRRHWLPNIISGVIVGVVALPLAMAFAIASGAKPEQGIYTAIIAGFAVSVLGGSRLQIAGPTGAFIVILSGITAKYGIAGLQTATLMAGVMLLFFGLARMGSIIKYIPAPVIIGFTAGIGVIIWVGQWQSFFGLPATAGEHFHEKLWYLLQAFPQLHLPTTLLAIFSLLLVIYTPKIPYIKRLPGPMVALVAATLIQSLIQLFLDNESTKAFFSPLDGIATIGTAFGGIPQGLPSFQLPDLRISTVLELISPAFTIAILGAIESLLSAVVADTMAGTRHNSNQELVGQGIANIVAPLFGGFAATGAIARTATNIRNGGTSPLSGIVHSITLIFVILLLAPLAVNVPLAALAAILFTVAWNMSQVKRLVRIIRQAPKTDIIILLVTFALTVFADLVVAVNIGVILAILQFLRRMANSVEVREVSQQELTQEFKHRGFTGLPSDVLVLAVEGPIFFGVAENIEHAFERTNPDPRIMIIRLRWVPFIDYSGIQAMEEAINYMHKHGATVMLTGANSRVDRKLKKAGIVHLIGEKNYFRNVLEALTACQKIHEEWLAAQEADTPQPEKKPAAGPEAIEKSADCSETPSEFKQN